MVSHSLHSLSLFIPTLNSYSSKSKYPTHLTLSSHHHHHHHHPISSSTKAQAQFTQHITIDSFSHSTSSSSSYSNDCSTSTSISICWLVSLLQSPNISFKHVRLLHSLLLYKRFSHSTTTTTTFVSNNLINAYLRSGHLAHARNVFDQMPDTSTVSWSAIINAYSNLGTDLDALSILSSFFTSGVPPNPTTFVCIFNLCANRSYYHLGKQFHACFLKSLFSSNLILDTCLSYFYAHCGDFPSAFCVFDRMKERDVVSWTTIITCCSQQGYAHHAISLFSQMLLHRCSPNEHTVSSVLKACAQVKDLPFGKQLHALIAKKSIRNDVFIGTSLVSMYSRCGEIRDARKVFDRMMRRNMVTWTSIITGYARSGLGYEALSLFRLMKRRRVVANNMTTVSILRACGSIGALRTGKEVHAQVLKMSAQNNVYIGSTLVWLYCKCREYDLASKVLQKMPLKDVVAWTAIISGCAHLGYEFEALEFLKKMLGEGVEPNPFTYSSLLKACANLEAIRQGRLIHSSVNKIPDFSSNVFVGSALINMYAKCGCVSEAFQVFSNMPERNLVSWRSMIVGYAKNGYCHEALKLMYQMQTEGIQVDDYLITTVLSACSDVEWNMDLSSQHCVQPST